MSLLTSYIAAVCVTQLFDFVVSSSVIDYWFQVSRPCSVYLCFDVFRGELCLLIFAPSLGVYYLQQLTLSVP